VTPPRRPGSQAGKPAKAGSVPLTINFGSGNWPATVPVAGDWNGDGRDGIGTYNLATGQWMLKQVAGTGDADAGVFTYGTANATYPVVGDWNSDGTDTVGVKVMAGSAWQLRNSNSAGTPDITFNYGTNNDLPLVWR
jgi:hypothetical protein